MNKKILLSCLFFITPFLIGHFCFSADDFRIYSDPELRAIIREAIGQCSRSIDVEVYKLTDRGVVRDLQKAARKGVVVRVILCPTQKNNQYAAEKLKDCGAAVRWYRITKQNQIMHIKMGIFDKKRLVFGSANWTYWGLTIHHEMVLNIIEKNAINGFQKRFDADWEISRPDISDGLGVEKQL